MYDIPELEKKWRKYRRKKIIKPIVISISSFVLLGSASYFGTQYFSNSNSSSSVEVTKSNKSGSSVAPANNNVVAQNQVQNKVTKEINSVNNIQKAPIKKEDDTPAIVITKIPQTETVVAKNVVVPTPKVASATTQSNGDNTIDLTNAEIANLNVPEEETRLIGFSREEKADIQNKYQDLLEATPTNKALKEKAEVTMYEERFRSTQDPQDSLYLAKYYYNKGNYEKAETWAVNTNNIDGDIEDSWIIFAKARAKQGHRVDAIKVLQSYYDETNSPKAKALLDKLRHNKPFK